MARARQWRSLSGQTAALRVPGFLAGGFLLVATTSGAASYGGANGNGGQNVGNCISDRPSCRVLAPPGGRSPLTLGGTA